MSTPFNKEQNEMLNSIQAEMSSLKVRLESIEEKLGLALKRPVSENAMNANGSVGAVPDFQGINWEKAIGQSYIGWLGIIVSLIAVTFLVRLSFLKEWIHMSNQPVLLAFIGLVLVATGIYLRKQGFKKFCITLGTFGLIILFLSVYWSTIRTNIFSLDFLVYGSILVWLLTLAWGLNGQTSVWPQVGFVGASILSIFILKTEISSTGIPTGLFLAISTFLFFGINFIFSKWKDWRWFPIAASVCGFIIIISLIQQLKEITPSYWIFPWILISISALLILWSGVLHILDKRNHHRWEIVTNIINNLLIFVYIFSISMTYKNSFIFLIPVFINGILVLFSYLKKNKYWSANLFHYSFTISILIAITVLLNEPFDIILLCLLSISLAHLGSIKQSSLFKGLSGMIITWCLIFLFGGRFDLSFSNEIPIINLRFLSFFITFSCFAYQGKLINMDTSAKKWGPFLGQGLLGIGLLVLLLGLGRELAILFTGKLQGKLSNNGLLALTFLGGLFSFGMAYLGMFMKLSYIRLLALLCILGVVIKVLFFDLRILDPYQLVISFMGLACLLGGTSFLFKISSRRAKA